MVTTENSLGLRALRLPHIRRPKSSGQIQLFAVAMGISATSQSSTCENSRTARCKKHGNTLIGTLRKTYGPHFAKGCADDEKLSDVLHKLDEPSLSALVEDHEAGTLEAGECVDAELNPPRLPYRCPLLYGPRRTGFAAPRAEAGPRR